MSSQPGEATTFAELVVIHASDHGAATGSADARGWRPAMEDAVVVSVDEKPMQVLECAYRPIVITKIGTS